MPPPPERASWDLEHLRLPKALDADERAPRSFAALCRNARPSWEGGTIRVPMVAWTSRLADALSEAERAGHLVRGLEQARQSLANEARGLSMADAKSRSERGSRVSRLVLSSNDGTQRFYRQLERLVLVEGQRVLPVVVAVDCGKLAGVVPGASGVVRAVMVQHKQSVARVLSALLADDAA